MRQLFRTDEVLPGRATRDGLRWAKEADRLRAVGRGVYAVGGDEPTALDWARADVLRGNGEARGHLAGVLLGLDSVELAGRPTRRDRLPADQVVVVGGIRCANGLATLVDLAASLDDLTWEQALESALRMRLTTVQAIEASLPLLGASRVPGTARIRRVLQLRTSGVPPTASLLETLTVQLARTVPQLGELVRQYEVWEHGFLVARLDLSRPDIGFFFELDGQQHQGQPVYDAMRETAVVATTGWLPGRFTWTEITRYPKSSARKMAQIAAQARRRSGPFHAENGG